MERARFSGKKGSFEPSREVNRKMLKSGVDPAILLHRYKSGYIEQVLHGFIDSKGLPVDSIICQKLE